MYIFTKLVKHYCVWLLMRYYLPIEGLHNAVRTQSYAHDLPRSLVSFFYSTVWRKTTKHIILDSLHYRISSFTQAHVLIFLLLGCSLVFWYNKSCWTFCCVSHTKLWGAETNMAVRSVMTWKMSFTWRHMKTPYIHVVCTLVLILRVGGGGG